MIKVNLLRDVWLKAVRPDGKVAVVASNARSLALARFALIASMPGVLFAWEKWNIAYLESEFSRGTAEKERLDKRIAEFGELATRAKKAVEAKSELEAVMGSVKTLANHRLQELKALDQLQGMLGTDVWLKEIKIQGNKVSLSGFSLSEQGVDHFLESLSAAGFFSHVDPQKTESITMPEIGSVRSFEVVFEIGTG